MTQSITNSLDMIAAQPPAVIEALIEHTKNLAKHRHFPKERDAIRTAYIDYCEHSLRVAKERENRLYHAITGEPEEPSS